MARGMVALDYAYSRDEPWVQLRYVGGRGVERPPHGGEGEQDEQGLRKRHRLLPNWFRLRVRPACAFGPQPLHLRREAVNHAPLMARPEVAVWRVRADPLLLLGSPLTVVGEDVCHVPCSRTRVYRNPLNRPKLATNLPAGVG